jgi:hypothetical protein
VLPFSPPNMNISLRVAVSPKPGSRLEKCKPNSDINRHCSKLEQNQRKAVRLFPTNTSERKPRKANTSKVDGSFGGNDLEESHQHGPDDVDETSPLRPAQRLSHPPTSRREAVKKLRVARYGAGPRNDPFSVYPIPANGSVPRAVDICKNKSFRSCCLC